MIGLDIRARENQDQIHAVGHGRVKAGGQAAEPFAPTREHKNLCSKPSPLPAVGCVPGLQGDGGSTALRRLFTGPAAAQGPARADLVSLLSPGVPDGSTFHSLGFLPLSFSPTRSKSCTA